MRFGVEFRSHWRAWLAAALLAGLAGGILIAVGAGARRTDTAWPRYRAVYRFRDARVWGWTNDRPSFKRLESLPEVAAGSIGDDFGFSARDARGRPLQYGGDGDGMRIYASTDGNDGVTVDRWKLLSGRRPNVGRASEALLDSRAARTFGVKPGETIHLDIGGPITLKVVGVVAATDPVTNPAGVVRLTPAFYKARPYAPSYGYVLDVRLRRGAAGFPAFRNAVDHPHVGGVDDASQRSSEVQGSIP